MFDKELFKALIPAQVNDFTIILQNEGWIPGIVGGIVRDFEITGKIGTDFDFEVTRESEELEKDFKKLKDILSKKYEVENLEYQVLKIKIDNLEIEITLPRIEAFNDEKGHKNFEATFRNLPYEEIVKRRDFTINSIKIDFTIDGLEVRDPLDGLTHIKDKKLVPCSESFSKDPVRLLRAFRFKYLLGMEFSKDLETEIGNFVKPIESSAFHILNELNKSKNFFSMYRDIKNFLSDDFPAISDEIASEYDDPFLNYMISDSSWENCEKLITAFNLGVRKYRPLWQMHNSLLALKGTEFTFDFMAFLQDLLYVEKTKKLCKSMKTCQQLFGNAFVQEYLELDDENFVRMKTCDHPSLTAMKPEGREIFIFHHQLKVLYENQVI